MNNNPDNPLIIKPGIFKDFPEIISGISTRHWTGSEPPYYFNLSFRVGDKTENVKRNRNKFFKELGINEDRVSFQRQTHSVISNKVINPKFFDDSDSLYSNTKNNFLAISIADCIPILLYEPKRKVVAGIHSGWKGTLNKITTVTIEKLMEEFSIKAKNIFAYIGPGISFENFEVGKDVYDLFDNDIKGIRGEKYFVDLKKHNYFQLLQIGVKAENIEVSQYCSYKEKDLFHSYRRDKDKSGRMLGVIGLI